jgi:hypothetical protein
MSRVLVLAKHGMIISSFFSVKLNHLSSLARDKRLNFWGVSQPMKQNSANNKLFKTVVFSVGWHRSSCKCLSRQEVVVVSVFKQSL